MTSKLIALVAVLIISNAVTSQHNSENAINTAIDSWHKAAANADSEAYFNLMTPTSVFIGTDATENWTLTEFKAFAMPYFDKGKAWRFTPLQRHVFVDPENPNTAWFDEILNTQMKLCRGSGVMKLDEGQWKIQHYVLSIAIPNDNVKEVIALKQQIDSLLVKTHFKH